ncbi:MAG: UPF0182 family protein [Abditibacteriales bacterium]|nr:UPF0182 family protein [Abditibacteriales bacterium]MDW8367645.1 UPF0182 family protein [Abditibacteriales bacterium]
MCARTITVVILFLVLLLLFFGGSLIAFYTDFLWFQEVGYTSVFLTALKAKGVLFTAGAVGTFLLLWLNVKIARRRPRVRVMLQGDNIFEIRDREQMEPVVNRLLPFGIGFVALVAGSTCAALWEEVLRYLHPTPFGTTDPLFDKDIAFYVFQLPLLKAVYKGALVLLGLCAIVSALLYVFDGKVAASESGIAADPQVKPHLLTLVGLMLLVKAWGYRLNMFDLLYSPRGVAYGASYTDVHVVLPVLKVLMVVAALSAVFVLISGYRRGWKGAAGVVGVWLAISLLGGKAVPSVVQKLQVAPNELSLEQPYIQHNIRFTRAAYNLDNVEEKDFAAAETLTPSDLVRNRPTLENIRLWDHRPLLTSFEQLQEIRTYYDFVDVDVDRYMLNGEYRQVMLSAREMSYERLPSKLWINERLTYTHGYGAVVSPVNRIAGEGLPDFLVKNIPPTGKGDLKITRPEIYFGEISSDYVFVKTKAREFDYPAGDKNIYTTYQGSGGVRVGGFGRRLLFALRFKSLPILLNADITPNSRILFYRRVLERLKVIAPFLSFDRDPYLVISRGKLYWMCDAYTLTDMYPYSQPIRGMGNYIRNSVKAVVDAYNGTVSFYIADESDPLIRTYQKIFPRLFQPLAKMDADLRRHIRYPQTLFEVQARMFAVYHMTDPQVFYNKEDVWEIPPNEVGTMTTPEVVTMPAAGREMPLPSPAPPRPQSMEPYYVIMRLPGETREEFIQLIPFTPARKDNLRAWMCARNDPPHYGKLLVYNFPKAKLVYGPAQINARIEQEAQISKDLTLWRQGGSDVIRGNLLIIPIEESLLYVQPLYLKSAQSPIPELKRVLAAYGDKIVMETDLERSLAALFGTESPVLAAAPARVTREPSTADADRQPPTTSRQLAAVDRQPALARQALQHLQKARESARRDDWAGFGAELKKLEETLRRLSQEQ